MGSSVPALEPFLLSWPEMTNKLDELFPEEPTGSLTRNQGMWFNDPLPKQYTEQTGFLDTVFLGIDELTADSIET